MGEEDDMFCAKGDEGPKVEAMQRLVLAAGGRLPQYGADADYGSETASGLASVVGGDGETYGPKEYAALHAKVSGGSSGPHSHAEYVAKDTFTAHRHDEGVTGRPK